MSKNHIPDELRQPKSVLIVGGIFVAIYLLGAIANGIGLWETIEEKLRGNSDPEAIAHPTTFPTEQPALLDTPSTTIDCSQQIIGEQHIPSPGVPWVLEAHDSDRNIHVWSNHWQTILNEHKFLLPAGESVTFMSGGGAQWLDQPGCNGPAKLNYDNDPLPAITLEDYNAYINNGTQPSLLSENDFCFFITPDELEEVSSIRGAGGQELADWVQEKAGGQEAFTPGTMIPEGYIIATNLFLPADSRDDENLREMGLQIINVDGSHGLFKTLEDYTATTHGVYWCIRNP